MIDSAYTSLSLCSGVDMEDKPSIINIYSAQMIDRLMPMFRYEGLPETIPERAFKLQLFLGGYTAITEVPNRGIYAIQGGLGGTPDPYYMPTIYTVANPALNYSRNLIIDKECVIIPCDSMYRGLLPIIKLYATLLTENTLTMNLSSINSRLLTLVGATDDNTAESARRYFKDLQNGKIGVIAENSFLDGIRTHPVNAGGGNNLITQLIELQQYLKAGYMNDIGLQANYNMKRETLNSAETQLDTPALLPLVDDMLNTQRTAFEKVKTLYGLDISVSIASAWVKQENSEEPTTEENPEEPEVKPDETE